MKKLAIILSIMLLVTTGCSDPFASSPNDYDNKVGTTQTCELQGYQLYELQVYSRNGSTDFPPIKINCKTALQALLDAGKTP